MKQFPYTRPTYTTRHHTKLGGRDDLKLYVVHICFNDLHPNCTLFVLQLYIRRSLYALRETQCTLISYRWADPGGRAVSGMGLRPLACCFCVFELRRVFICVVCCECWCVIR